MKKYLILLGMLFTLSCNAQLPSISLKDINGKSLNTAMLNNDGKPFIISFFAIWCKPCLRELKAIQDVYNEWHDETGMKLIAISVDEAQNSAKVKPMADRLGWDYDVLLDPNGDFKRAMGVNMIPAVFIVDGDGKIVDSRTGYTDGSEEHLIEKIRELVN